MKISLLKTLLVVSLVFNLSALGAAGYLYYQKNRYWETPFGVKVRKDRFLFEELSLRPDQIKKMREKAIPFRAEIDRKRDEIAAKRNYLIGLLRADPPDARAIKATLFEISRIQEEVEAMVATHILQEKETLDKDQQKRFLDLIQNVMMHGRPGYPARQD
jgi:Spy/CpxP family protein refolding chaperone